jgi:glutamate dehydrogenase (NADP+)
MLKFRHGDIDGLRVTISGSGNVAQFAAAKCIELGARVLSLSDSAGTVEIPQGLTEKQLAWVLELKNERRGRLEEFAREFDLPHHAGRKPWSLPCDIALPCATQNELDGDDAEQLLREGVQCVAEGANMPCTPSAVEAFLKARILFAPGKAANAGGVATSGLEMSQNALRLSWTAPEVDNRLHAIMQLIHHHCVDHGREKDGFVNYVNGANIAGFVKVADAMLAQGVI